MNMANAVEKMFEIIEPLEEILLCIDGYVTSRSMPESHLASLEVRDAPAIHLR